MPAAPANEATSHSWEYRQTFSLKEQNKSRKSKDADAIWCITFNFADLRHRHVFASCGGRRGTVYECKAGGTIQALQAYYDPNPEEEFFVCKWSINMATGAPLLLLAGATGAIRVVDCHLRKVVWVVIKLVTNVMIVQTAQGHGDAVNDIAVHPTKPALFVTASRDFHKCDGNKLLSAGMDHSIKIWDLSAQFAFESLKTYNLCDKMIQSSSSSCVNTTFKFAAQLMRTQSKVHWAYVDCVRWLGDIILSKSVHNKVFLWEPDLSSKQTKQAGYVKCYQEYKMEKAKVWFIRMALNLNCNVMACGNTMGQVFLWDMRSLTDKPQAVLSRECVDRSHSKSTPNITVRQTAVSHDASIVLACCEDGTIWRWDAVKGVGVCQDLPEADADSDTSMRSDRS